MILDGKKLAEDKIEELKKKREDLGKIKLACVLVGGDEASLRFIKRKREVAQQLQVKFRLYKFREDISTTCLRGKLAQIKKDYTPQGLVVQLPLPEGVNQQYILDAIPRDMDCDVLGCPALGTFYTKGGFQPPVVSAIMKLLKEAKVEISEAKVVIVGAGKLVGKPMAVEAIRRKATVIVCEKNTDNLSFFTKRADILITGTGYPGLITKEMVKKDACVIDAGAPAPEVDFKQVQEKAKAVSPVPGGVGPLTVAYLYDNLLRLVEADRRG